MKKILTALAVTAFGIALGTFVSLATNERALAANADDCIQHSGIEYMTGQNRARVQVDLGPNCGNRTLVMKTWYAKSLDDGTQEFHDTQWLMETGAPVSLKPSDAPTYVKVQIPNKACFHQIDLVDITNPNDKRVVTAKIGGSRDCRPIPQMSCDAFNVTKGDNRTVTVNNFKYTAVNATVKSVVLDWGDGSQFNGANLLNQTHTYSEDKTYNLQVTMTFEHRNRLNTGTNTQTTVSPNCKASVSFSPSNPGTQQVCELSTKNIVTIPAGSYDTSKYAPVNDPRCKNQNVCELSTGKVVTIPGGSYDTSKYGPVDDPKCKTTTTTTSTTPTAELTKTGPGAVVALFGAAATLGTAGHMIVSRRRS